MPFFKNYKPAIRATILSLLFLSTSSCSLMAVTLIHAGSALHNGREDVSKDYKFAHIINKSFRLKTDAFYYKCPDENTKYLETEFHNGLPHSVKDYEKDPQNWMYTDGNAKIGHGPDNGYGKLQVFGVVRAGTEITITHIFKYQSFVSGDSFEPYATIEEGPFRGCQVNASHLFNSCRGTKKDLLSIDIKKIEEIKWNEE